MTDTQGKGGPEYGYRCRVSNPVPDFELRIVPASITCRAGEVVSATVHALRKDGFAGDIEIVLKDAPPGVVLDGGWLLSGQDEVRLTLRAPATPPAEAVCRITLEGRARIGEQDVLRPVVPAEDMMQAFIYHHLVPASELLLAVKGRGRGFQGVRVLGEAPVHLIPGVKAVIELSTPGQRPIKGYSLALSDPPPGITIRNVTWESGRARIELTVDLTIEPGSGGNLIFEVFMQRSSRRVSQGLLPAVPFRVIGV